MNRFQNNIYITIAIFIASLTYFSSVSAQNRVVVIPMAGDAEPLQNIITVGKSNGDFIDPIAAMNSISNASSSNPYLIVIGPGSYTLSGQLVMKDYVSITGSGIKTTTIRGSVGANGFTESAALVIGAEGVEISNITIRNAALENNVITVHSSQEDMRIINSRIIADSSLTGSQYAIVNQTSELKLFNSEVISSNGLGNCFGVYSFSNSILKINNIDINLNCNFGTQYGIFVTASAVSHVDNAHIDISQTAEDSYGYFSNGNNSRGYIQNSIVGGTSSAIYGGNSTGIAFITHVLNSDLRSDASGNVDCLFSRLNTGFTLDDECISFSF